MLIPTYWQIDSYPLLQGSLWAMGGAGETHADAPKDPQFVSTSQLKPFVFQSVQT